MKQVLVLALLGAVGCKSEGSKDESDPKAESKKDSGAEASKEAKEAKDAATSTEAEVGFCDEPCRALVDSPLEEVASRVKSECKTELVEEGSCEDFDYLRNCVYASKGYRFRKAKWREKFGSTSWYEADPKFSNDMIPRVGFKNVKALKDRAAECRASAASELTGKVLANLSVDLDGDGKKDKVRVTAKAVEVGGEVVVHGLEPEAPGKLTAKSIDIDRGDKQREVLLARGDFNDLINYVVVSMSGGKPRVSSEIVTPSLEVSGGGEITTKDTNCGQTTTVVYRLKKGKVVKHSEDKTGAFDEIKCAACPYVYLKTSEGWAFRGEILREVRHAASEATRSMSLGRAASTTVVVRVAERKPEITYLDELAVYADGERLQLAACAEVAPPAWCDRDGAHHALERGDALDLTVEVAPGASLELRATGYYVPL